MDLSNPIVLAGAAVVAMLAISLVLRKRDGKEVNYKTPGVKRMVKNGQYAEAAKRALDHENIEEAIELFLAAKLPGQAARAAARAGKKKQAAELFEWAGDKSAAAHYYEQAGNLERADELRAAGAIPRDDSASASSVRAQTGLLVPKSGVSGQMGGVKERPAVAGTTPRERADNYLAQGDVKSAAEELHAGGLIEEAVYLYVNVLGQSDKAAPLVSELGNFDRAAELFEIAGERKRAAAEWVKAARKSAQPLSYARRIESLDPAQAVAFLQSFTEGKMLTQDSADLYYELAETYERQGKFAEALREFEAILGALGDYRGVVLRVASLRGGHASATVVTPTGTPMLVSDSVQPIKLSEVQLEQLVSQVASAAAEQIRVRTLDDIVSLARPSADGGPSMLQIALAQGLEREPLKLQFAFDGAAQVAKNGPGIETLTGFLGARECDLGNIEVYYRLGLAHQAKGDWERAMKAFDAVEECSPGYRDAWKRAGEIQKWQQAVHHTRLQPKDTGNGRDWKQRYELMGELGRGGMAVVYRARDRVLEREVAMKFMSENLAGNDLAELFTREAKAVASLNHPNVVTIYDFGTFEEKMFICMEFVQGRTIESLLTDQELTVVDSLRVLKQVLDGLGFAHSQHIVHRDIKPANVMRTSDGRVKIMDFGLAKALRDPRQSSMIAGTPAYMPPEQLAGRELDHRADIFAVGVTMYEMLTNSMPFEGMERSKMPPPMREFVPAISEILDEAVMKAMAIDPSKRFATADEMAAPIAGVLAAVNQFVSAHGTKSARLGKKPAPGPTIELLAGAQPMAPQ